MRNGLLIAALICMALFVGFFGAAYPQSTPSIDELATRIAETENALEQLKSPEKDIWDKMDAASGLITGGLVALVVFIATQWLNQRQSNSEAMRREELASAERVRSEEIRAAEAAERERDRASQEAQSDRDAQILKVQTVQGLIPHLASNDPTMVSAALLAVEALGDGTLTEKLATLFRGKGSLDAMFRVIGDRDVHARGSAELALGEIISGYQSSIVKILNDDNLPVATGFFVRDGGSILTTKHAVASIDSIGIETSIGERISTKATSVSDEYDLALLSVEDTTHSHLPLDTNSQPKLFSKVAVLGIPGGRVLSARLGEITSTTADFTASHRKMIEFRMASEPGMSGAPVINSDGNVIGILVGTDPRRELTYAVAITGAQEAFGLAAPKEGYNQSL